MGRGLGAVAVGPLKTSGPRPDKKFMRPLPLRVLLIAAVTVATLVPARAAFAFSDVPKDYWDYDAIQYVASTHTWMQDYGTGTFQPATKENREQLAKAAVLAFAPTEPIDPTITFPDLPTTDPFYPYANVAVKLGWIEVYKTKKYAPLDPVKLSLLDRALVLALGLTDEVAGLANIHADDGTVYTVEERFPHMQLARWLGLHYNHDDETLDLQKNQYIPRDEMAYSLWMASTMDSWKLDDAAMFDDITLATPTTAQKSLTQFALNYVGPPYIWAGEWYMATGGNYCCGVQPQGGYDCSGFVWWVLKKNEDGYNAAQFHPDYKGWVLHERSSYQMAEFAPTQIKFKDLLPGNLMFFASNGGSTWSDVDHVGIFLGNNWMIHSTDGGPQIEWVGDGYYYDNYVFGRGLKSKDLGPAGVFDLTAGEPAIGP
jgi:hypothetical protein